jgi:serine/threonine protein kinase
MLGPYQIEAEIGRGAMGAVYRAEHTRLKRKVALKILPIEYMVPDRVSRFHREMEAIGRLDHPNIVRATDAGDIAGFHYLAMELVTGADVGSVVSRVGRLDVGAACEVVRQTALGLQHISENKLVHRDVKPSNLFLASEGVVKILDLGIAMLRRNSDTSSATSIGAMMGTPDYIAPEQIEQAHDVDIRADIYSLGCTLFTLLAGNPPFTGPSFETHIAKILAHRDHVPPDLKTISHDIPDDLARTVARMMAKRPADRQQTPSEVATAMSTWADAPRLKNLALAAAGTRGTLDKFTVPVLHPSQCSDLSRPAAEPHRPRRAISAIVGAAGIAGIVWLALAVSRAWRNDLETASVDTRTALASHTESHSTEPEQRPANEPEESPNWSREQDSQPLRQVADNTERISQDSRRLADTSQEIRQDTKRIAETLEDLRDAFQAAARDADLIDKPRSAGQLYHNARVLERQGDYGAARDCYGQLFEMGVEYVDVHRNFQSTLKLREGIAGARRTYRQLPGDPHSPTRALALAMLEDQPERERRLQAIVDREPDFAPAVFELSRCSAEEAVGQQSLVHKNREKDLLETFLRLHEEGHLLRHFLDSSMAAEMVSDAERRLASLQALDAHVFEQPVRLTFNRQRRQWTVVFHLAETAREIFYRIDPADEFQSTGFIDHFDPKTGRQPPLTLASIPIQSACRTIEVKYLDIAGVERGPYKIPFDAETEILRDAIRKLGFVKQSWVNFGPGKEQDQLFFTVLARYHNFIREVRYAFDAATPTIVHELRDPDQPIDGTNYVTVPPETRFVVVQVTFVDGTQSEIVRYPRVVE